jgi:hypothetical protein
MKLSIAVLLALSVLNGSVCWAQQAPVHEQQLEQRLVELSQWLESYRRWEQWIAVNGNRPAQSLLGHPKAERMERPEPPAWLTDECSSLIGYEGQLGEACDIIRTWRGLAHHLEGLNRNPQLATAGSVVNDRVVKSSFWQRVHLTGMWTPGQIPPPPLYGVVGMQIGVVEIGRVTVPAVGVMLVTLTGADGKREWKPATSISVSFRLVNFALNEHTASLHFNISRLTINAVDRVGPANIPVDGNFIGLSVSFKKG